MVKALSERRPEGRGRLLVVDADLEAPGLTWWARTLMGAPDISFLDLLALAQYDTSPDHAETLRLVAQRLQQQPLIFETTSGRVELYFLPAFRDFDQAMRMPLRPEHLVQVPGQEWLLGNLLACLGRELGCQAVLIDVRAGLSEVASPLLFDPRIRRILVTSTSSQSVDGTCALLAQLRKLAPAPYHDNETGPTTWFDPLVILSLVPSGQEHLAMELRERLLQAYPNGEDADVLTPVRLRVEETAFAEELLHLDGFRSAWEKLTGTSVARVMAELATEWLPPHDESAARWTEALDDPTTRQELRQALAETAGRLVMAESGYGEEFLRTSALERLGHRFQYELPLAVVMGAKGAGKTYMFLQMLRRRTWGEFLHALRLAQAPLKGRLLPLIEPANLKPAAQELVAACRSSTLAQWGGEWRLTRRELVDAIRTFVAEQPADETQWRRFWVRLIGRTLGLELDPLNPEVTLNQALEQRDSDVVVVIDGLEDLFQDLPRHPGQQVALRALCQDLPGALRELPGRRVGLVVFIRKDLLKAAVVQNFGQFESLHASYELHWSPDEALRLAVWLCHRAGLRLWVEQELPLEYAPREMLERSLYPVWGYKLGGPESREARTVTWVLAALSDFGGRLQARDVVRFFRYAAERARQLPEYHGRLLQPAAVRYAIEPCSREKVDEVQQEIPWLAEIFNRFRQVPDRRIPFRADDFRLGAEEVRLLAEVGVVLEEKGALYMPEIFRHGLGFRLEKGARPRVITLMRRALGSL